MIYYMPHGRCVDVIGHLFIEGIMRCTIFDLLFFGVTVPSEVARRSQPGHYGWPKKHAIPIPYHFTPHHLQCVDAKNEVFNVMG